tara:strand:+ start:5297 stop:7537 length:2241 start_codon:yes stop_codon:yes gene_type:complete
VNEPDVDLDLALEHGLTEQEYAQIIKILGRTPSFSELGIFSVMWSEHCSYKSSKRHLKTLPVKGPHVLQGPGENAGAISLGDGLAAVFKIESHNHPSFIEPKQGAATGVGGILRDIFTMGARPIASLNSIRFGSLADARHRFLLRGVVSGIGHYGNCVGVATVGGETQFHDSYAGNILVNAMSVGIAEESKIFLAGAKGVGNPVIYAGSKTGRDGIHGASLLASSEFDETGNDKRPTVQVGDPFTEKCLIEACLELMSTDAIVGIQDMGAAGLTCSSFEMASNAGTGIEMNLDTIPRRAATMTPYELLLSESQERMLLVAQSGKEEFVCSVFERWGLDAVVVGKVTDDGRMRVSFEGSTVVDIPVDPVAASSPELNRPSKEPEDLGARQSLNLSLVESESDPEAALKALLSDPNLGSKSWVYRQYDQRVQGNTLIGPGGDAALVRVKRPDGSPTTKALAISVDCNHRFCWLDPEKGAMAAVAEAGRNVACTGAKPLAVTNCLNFGNPEKPEIMWELKKAIKGISIAASALGTPIVSGNVSLYNETNGTPIFPTPTIGMVGLIDDWADAIGAHFKRPYQEIILIGTDRFELGGSMWLAKMRGIESGRPPEVDLGYERRLQKFLVLSGERRLLSSSHDISDGGIAVALAESCFGLEGCGASVTLNAESTLEECLFGESTGRVLVTTDCAEDVLSLARDSDVPAIVVGKTGGERLKISSLNDSVLIDVSVAQLKSVWEDAIPSRMDPEE